MAIQRPIPYRELLYVDALKAAGPLTETELQRLRELAQGGDPEAAFRVGRAVVRREPSLEPDEAAPWFIRAIENGGSTWAWLATEAYDQDPRLYRAAVARAITADYPRPDAPGIQVAPDTIEPVDEGDWDMSPVSACFQIGEDSDIIRLALGRAVERLALVDERGREYASGEQFQEEVLLAPDHPLRPDGQPLFTIEWTSLELDDPRGPYLLTDAPEAISGPMMRTMIRIVVDELLDAGVLEAHLGPYRPLGPRSGNHYAPPPPSPADPP